MRNITLLKFKDKFGWLSTTYASPEPQTITEAIANGVWQFRIPKEETLRAIREMSERQTDTATFGDNKKFLYSEQQIIPLK
jgi:hypothetical protein